MRTPTDVLIIGGGVIGLTTAYYLARDGATVTVLDRAEIGGEASWAGAGHHSAGQSREGRDAVRPPARHQFTSVSEPFHGIGEFTGIDNGYRVCGGIEVFERPAPDVISVWQAEGIEHRPLNEDELRQLEPQRARVGNQAVSSAHDGPGAQPVAPPCPSCRLSPCRSAHRSRSTDRAIRHRERSSPPVAIAESGEDYPADQFLIASVRLGGSPARTTRLAHGHSSVRGQIVLYHPPAPLLCHVVCVEKRYLVPREDGRILVGSTEEPEAGFEKRHHGHRHRRPDEVRRRCRADAGRDAG